jgi:HK97 family phage portal protein
MVTSPFEIVSLDQGLTQIMTSLVLRGNAYLIVAARDSAGLPTSLFIASPDAIKVVWVRGVRSYVLTGNVPIPTEDMIHISGMMLAGALTGMSMIEYVRSSIGMGIALDGVASKFFANGIMSSGLITVPENMEPDDIKALAKQFVSNHSGVNRAHLPIITSGEAKYTQLSLTPDDAQFLQSREFQALEMARLFGIPLHLLQMQEKSTSWGAGLEIQGRAFVDYTLRPFYQRIAQAISLCLPPGQFAEFVTDEITKADTATRYANYNIALGGQGVGWLCVDEVRRLEGLPPLPNGAGQIYRALVTTRDVSNDDGPILVPVAPAPPLPAIPTLDPNAGEAK